MQYAIEFNNTKKLDPILYLAATVFSRDTETTDFLLLVSYVVPCANRNGVLPCVHLSDDSGSGNELARDVIAYLQSQHHDLTDNDQRDIVVYLTDLVRAYHDPDQPHAPSRLLLRYSQPYRNRIIG